MAEFYLDGSHLRKQHENSLDKLASRNSFTILDFCKAGRAVASGGDEQVSDQREMKIIPVRTPESKQFAADVERAMRLTSALNRLTYADGAEVQPLFEELSGHKVGEHFRLIPPFYTDGGKRIHVGARVFINQNCTFYAMAEINIGDDVFIGPNVSLLTSEHPIAPSQRRTQLVGRPITIKKGVWIAAGAIIIGGVTVGENSVIAAGSVVTRNIPANTFVGGNPARIIRSIEGE